MSALSRDRSDSSATSASQFAAMIGYALALAVFALRISGEFATSVELAGAVALATVVAVPPTLALVADSRPLLLLPAGLIALNTLFALSILALPMLAAGLVWLWAYSKSAPRGRVLRKLTVTVLVSVLWLLAAATLFVHIDPRCTETLSDGTVRVTDPAPQGFETGWVWEIGSTSSGSTTFGVDVVSSQCPSDRVVWWEALVVLALSGDAILSGWLLATPPASAVPVLTREPMDPTSG